MKKEIKQVFEGKKITVMGLGLLGGALNDTKFLAECGAELTVTDLKTAEQLKTSLDKLKKYKNIKYVLGEHRLDDFRHADLVLQPGNVPLDSIYLAEAKKNNIPIYVSESLFAEYVSPEVKLVGITGTRGKSTTTQLVYEILQAAKFKNTIHLAGNVKNVSTLNLLDKVKPGDIVVMELDSWALHGMGDIKKSPHVAVFTNFMVDHQNFYKEGGMSAYFADKANIFANQKEEDFLVMSRDAAKVIRERYKTKIASDITVVSGLDVPRSWKIKLLGEHNRENIALAIDAARMLGVSEKVIKKAVEDHGGLPGRLEFVREAGGIKFYNDTNASSPDGAVASIKALLPTLKKTSGLVLLSGGTDKALNYKEYIKTVDESAKELILFKGTATDKILPLLPKKHAYHVYIVESMKDAVAKALAVATKGDIVLLSPGAASFGIFKNEYDRGDQFVKEIGKVK